MITLTNVNALEGFKMKSCKYIGVNEKESSYVLQRTEGGTEYNMIRWIAHEYQINLQWLTANEIRTIIQDLQDAKRADETITISKNKLLARGYVDLKVTEGEPIFYFDLKYIKPKAVTGSDKYELEFKVFERVNEL